MKPITQENDRLGFIGIGYMGRPIARRLLESGFKLTAVTGTTVRQRN
jgi:3-hydroxyisobutyrate dehydrogenase-like beta-hydroxyacid dehydrogenase